MQAAARAAMGKGRAGAEKAPAPGSEEDLRRRSMQGRFLAEVGAKNTAVPSQEELVRSSRLADRGAAAVRVGALPGMDVFSSEPQVSHFAVKSAS